MAVDFSALKTEILSDPKGMGYGPLVSTGRDIGIANLLNSLTGSGAGPVDRLFFF